MAHTLDAAEAMSAAVQRAGVALSVCFPMRYDPRVVIAKRLIEAGALGRLTGFHGRLLMEKEPSYWLGGYSGRSISGWRAVRDKAGGGILIMNLSHYIDLVRYLGSEELEDVKCAADAVDEPSEVEDSIVLSLRSGSGALGSLIGASAARGTLSEELRLWGRDGHITVDPIGRVFTLRAIPGVRTTRWQKFQPSGGSAIRAVYLSRLATALAEDREPEVDVHDGLAVQRVIEAAYQSAGLARDGTADATAEVERAV